MKKSKLLNILTSCLLIAALPSCSLGNSSQNDNISSVSQRRAIFTGYADIPVDKDYIPIYSQADTASGGVTPVFYNDELKVLSESDEWYEVECNGYTGYLQKEYVSKDRLDESQRPTRPPKPTTTTTVATTTEAETTTTKSDKDKDKDKTTTTSATTTVSDSTQETTAEETSAEPTTEPTTTQRLPASAYPDVNISLDIVENSSGKYDAILTMDGRYTRYVYELHRVFADGTDKIIASGESGDTQLKLATIESLTTSQTIDRLVITTYHNSVAGNKVTLDVDEPKAD